MNLKCRVVGGTTGPFRIVGVFRVVRPVPKVWLRLGPYLEPSPECGPVAITTGRATTFEQEADHCPRIPTPSGSNYCTGSAE